jgi:hypothetical protein
MSQHDRPCVRRSPISSVISAYLVESFKSLALGLRRLLFGNLSPALGTGLAHWQSSDPQLEDHGST